MSYNFKSESDVKEYLHNLGVEYRFGCYSEKNPEVCHLLGDYLEVIKKEYRKASNVYKDNCDNYNYGKSCYKFGNYLLLGKGDRKVDYKTAYGYHDKACGLGEADACLHQGLLSLNPESDSIKYDPLKAIALLEKACLAKKDKACYFVSSMYINGVKRPTQDGKNETKSSTVAYDVPKNMEKAFKYAVEGCNMGHPYCCANVSQMYARGDGVEKNPEMAEKYKKIALEIQEEMQSTHTLKFQQGIIGD